MANHPSPDPRSELLGLMLTQDEKEAVKAFAHRMGMSMSSAGRYLLREGLKASGTSTQGE